MLHTCPVIIPVPYTHCTPPHDPNRVKKAAASLRAAVVGGHKAAPAHAAGVPQHLVLGDAFQLPRLVRQ